MNPADNQVAIVWRVIKITASIFKLNEDVLQSLSLLVNAALAFAIRIVRADGFYEKTQFTAYHSKQIDNTLLVDRSETQPPKVDRLAELNPLGADYLV